MLSTILHPDSNNIMPRYFTLKNITPVSIIKEVRAQDLCEICQFPLADLCTLCQAELTRQHCQVVGSKHTHCTRRNDDLLSESD